MLPGVSVTLSLAAQACLPGCRDATKSSGRSVHLRARRSPLSDSVPDREAFGRTLPCDHDARLRRGSHGFLRGLCLGQGGRRGDVQRRHSRLGQPPNRVRRSPFIPVLDGCRGDLEASVGARRAIPGTSTVACPTSARLPAVQGPSVVLGWYCTRNFPVARTPAHGAFPWPSPGFGNCPMV